MGSEPRQTGTAASGTLVLLLAFLTSLSTGCQTASLDDSLTATLGGNDVEARMEFWHALTDRPIVTNDEAFHGVLLFLDQADPAANYAQRVETLRVRGLLPHGFDRPANEAATRGTLAVILVSALKIKGGVVMQVFGPSPRYAVRELRYEGLYLASSPHQTFSGAQFVGLIGRAEDYERVNQP